ncbi:MAG: SUMF1/EgtB/PvdO family nonheme iron enzyme, partial [Candidatus Sericytochromatia bacterium]|nr:SUMF1/EgtB/PvdO family nonheme iron enzyme [Candidatus Tanganyikabacteria bacterium]
MRSSRPLIIGIVSALAGCAGLIPVAGLPGKTGADGPAPQGPVFGTVVDAQGKRAGNVTVTAFLASSTPLNNASPLLGNAGSGLVGNGGSGLAGNSGGSLTNPGASLTSPEGAGTGLRFLAERSISATARRLAAGIEVKTDAAGRFALTPSQAGVYNVEAVESAKSKAWKAAVTYSGPGSPAEVGKLGLAPTGQISGKVKSTIPTVTDFSNTSVYIPGSGYIAITRSDGTYTIPDVPAGSFDLAAFNNELGDGKLPDQDNPGLVRVVSGETTSAAPLLLKTTPPEITSITRAESLEITDNGAPGTAIDIHGRFFGFNRGVRFEVRFAAETGLQPDRLAEDLIRVKVPGAALNGNLQVFVGGLQSTNVKAFRVMKTLTTKKQSLSLAAGAEHDFGADVAATDTKGDPIVEIVENAVTKLARPNITWLVDSNKGFVSERGVFKALAAGTVVVSGRAGDLPGFTIPVTILPAGTTEPTPGPSASPGPTASPGSSGTPSPAPTASGGSGGTSSPSPTPTPVPSPTPTPTPAPSPTPTPVPSPTPTPPPSPTPTPTPAPTLPPFASIPAGSFTMGSPADEPGRFSDETQHPVKLTRGFYMQTTEVTQAQWQALMGNNPSYFTGDATRPVERVSWWDAVAYANALSAAEGRSPAYVLTGCSGTPGSGDYGCSGISLNSSDGTPYGTTGYRLPTEAEWEYAYRAGTSTAFYNGTITSPSGSDAKLDLIGWYGSNSGGTTRPVGQKQANGWGLYDMAGNVWEWCWDWYGAYPV